jgi:aerotaxis receptor
MVSQTSQSKDHAADDEVPFGIEEMFYSRTDPRGVILAGNAVFRRVAGYGWGQLIGAPHRIVRHPATPRAVFRILWSTIQKGEPAVAYVCNKASDGRHYWVLATVLPFGDSYLSVRIKPASALFATVQTLYATLAAEERAGLSVEASVARLLACLSQAGFASYPAFMRHALAEETSARAAQVSARAAPAEMGRIRQGLSEVIADQEVLVSDFERLRILPTNMRILASRLEPEGGPVGAISDIYLMISSDIFAKVGAFSLGEGALCQRMSERFEQAAFLITCAGLQAEVAAQARVEAATGALAGSGLDAEAEAAYLADLGKQYHGDAARALDEAMALAGTIHEASLDLRRAMLSLETITVMGRVESARIGEAGLRINDTINRLHDGNLLIGKRLSNIDDLARVLTSGMRHMQKSYLHPGLGAQVSGPQVTGG